MAEVLSRGGVTVSGLPRRTVPTASYRQEAMKFIDSMFGGLGENRDSDRFSGRRPDCAPGP